jgi:anti-sigma B factor antagonist
VTDDLPVSGDEPLSFSVSRETGYTVVSVAGELDAGTEGAFRDALTSALALALGVPRVVVDLTAVTFMASAGIGVLMGMHRTLKAEGGSLVLAGPRGEVAQVLSLTGVGAVIPVAATVADAVARLDSGPRELRQSPARDHVW